jgi:hypothetical protein
MTSFGRNKISIKEYVGMRLFFLTIPKPLKQYTLFKKDDPFRFHACAAQVFMGCAFPCNDTVEMTRHVDT